MKGLFILAFVIASAVADVSIDYREIRPIEHYPRFWDDKPEALRPSASFFEQVEVNRRVGRIVGGSIASPHQFPYQAGVLMFIPSIGGQALCGGTLISNQHVLTAARKIF